MSTTVKKEVISWVKTILLAAVLAGLVNSFLIVNAGGADRLHGKYHHGRRPHPCTQNLLLV